MLALYPRFAILTSLLAFTLSPMPAISVAVEPEQRGVPEGDLAIAVNGKGIKVHVPPTSSDLKRVGDEIQHASDIRREERSGVPGTVDIVSSVSGSAGNVRLASLALNIPSGGSSDNGSPNNDPFILNASGMSDTAIYLTPGASIPSSRDMTASSAGSDVLVSLQAPALSSDSPEHCVTIDPNHPKPLTTEPCPNTTTADVHKSHSRSFSEDDRTPDRASQSAPLSDSNSGHSEASSNGATSSSSITLSNGTTSAVTAGSNAGSFGKRDDVSTRSHNVTLAVPGDAAVEDVPVPASTIDSASPPSVAAGAPKVNV